MSVSVAGMLQAGQAPATEAAVVKDLGTNWEQALPRKARLLLAPSDAAASPNGNGYAEAMYFNTLIAPKLTIQGGTREVLRGIIARGLGLRRNPRRFGPPGRRSAPARATEPPMAFVRPQ